MTGARGNCYNGSGCQNLTAEVEPSEHSVSTISLKLVM